jgi:hypothetical protein
MKKRQRKRERVTQRIVDAYVAPILGAEKRKDIRLTEQEKKKGLRRIDD